jgi:hypothetical protein
MRQVRTLLFKNWLVLTHSKRELFVIIGLTIALSGLAAFLNNGSFYRKVPQEPAMPVYGIPMPLQHKDLRRVNLWVAPDTNETMEFMHTVAQYLKMMGFDLHDNIWYAANASQLDTEVRKMLFESSIGCGVVASTGYYEDACFGINFTSLEPPKFAYTIISNNRYMPDTTKLFLDGGTFAVCRYLRVGLSTYVYNMESRSRAGKQGIHKSYCIV